MNKFKRTLSGAAENKVIDEDYKDCDEGGNPITARFSDDLPKKMVAWIDSKGVTIFMTVLTIFVLWGDDLREPWLDMIGSLSIVPDIKWIYNELSHVVSGTSNTEGPGVPVGDGVQSARVVRLVRLIRLIRIVRLYSVFRKVKDADAEDKLRMQALAAQNAKQAALKRLEASRLGKVLTEMTTRRVVVIILLVILIRPYLTILKYDSSKHIGLAHLFWYGRSNCESDSNIFHCDTQKDTSWITERGWKNLIKIYADSPRHEEFNERLLWLFVPDRLNGGILRSIESVDSDFGTWNEFSACSLARDKTSTEVCPYRPEELELVSYVPTECLESIQQEGIGVGCQEAKAFARFTKAEKVRDAAQREMITTLCVCVLLGSMAVQIQNLTQTLVIAPIEKMVNIIKQLAEDPLKKPDLTTFEESEVPKQTVQKKTQGPQLETTMLENTILKIGGLLQVGFGEAGAQIIGKNMASGDGELNIMMPGNRVVSVFGFVDIRQFTDTTECLEEEVMVFVNTIGCILHQCVHRWSGVSNKNIGDAFLLLWKLPSENSGRGRNDAAARTSDISNRALLSFIKFYAECRRSPRINAYKFNPRIIKRFGEGYKVNFGLALHTGWAIEGPIGSDFKVDASYLSPHVNITMTLESSTKIYGVILLMSEKFYMMLSVRTKERIRKVDIVHLGSGPQGLFTFPLNDEHVLLNPPNTHICGEVIKSTNSDVQLDNLEEEGAEYLFIVDQDVACLQKKLPEQVYSYFREAQTHWVTGDWQKAHQFCNHALEIDPHDGPSQAMVKFMARTNYEPPPEWPGYRSSID